MIKGSIRHYLRKNAVPYLFMLPGLFFIATFMIYPLVDGVRLSFYRWTGWEINKTFVGLSNFQELIYDARFWAAAKNNLVWTGISVPGVVSLGLLLALLLHLRPPGWKSFRFIYYLPVMLMIPVVAILWSRIYHPYSGLVNSLLELVGLGSLTRAWLGEPKLAFYAIIVIGIWKTCGWSMIIFLAAMSNIPEPIYDAVKIDGASTWQRTWLITLPMIKPLLILVITLQVIWSLKLYTWIWVMTEGGPGYSTEVVSVYMVYQAFYHWRIGYGSAIAVLFAGFMILASLFYVRTMARGTFEY